MWRFVFGIRDGRWYPYPDAQGLWMPMLFMDEDGRKVRLDIRFKTKGECKRFIRRHL